VTEIDSDVLVIGAGVIGLTTAICLAEAGVSTAIVSAEPPEQTTSFAAGAIWGPHLVGRDDRVARWADVTLARLDELTAPGIGANALDGIVHTAAGMAAHREEASAPPEFAAGTALAQCPPAEIPPGYRSAWRLRAPIVAMPEYLGYLVARFGRAGGATPFLVKIRSLSDARAVAPSARVIVNCTGCGARDLVPDRDVTPVRGQAVVTTNPGIAEFFVGTATDPADLTYLFPHGDVVVLGGTEEPGNWSLAPDPATADRILAACAVVRPELAAASVLAHRVGLRPARSSVRLAAEPADGVTVVHNYGHGGAGVTLSWGCAEDAAVLALDGLGALA
jgi:D-amino-acid oxidase